MKGVQIPYCATPPLMEELHRVPNAFYLVLNPLHKYADVLKGSFQTLSNTTDLSVWKNDYELPLWDMG